VAASGTASVAFSLQRAATHLVCELPGQLPAFLTRFGLRSWPP